MFEENGEGRAREFLDRAGAVRRRRRRRRVLLQDNQCLRKEYDRTKNHLRKEE